MDLETYPLLNYGSCEHMHCSIQTNVMASNWVVTIKYKPHGPIACHMESWFLKLMRLTT